MRSVNVWSGAESSALTVEVADDASLQQIVAQVAKKCGVPRTNVFVSVDGQRAHQLQQVRVCTVVSSATAALCHASSQGTFAFSQEPPPTARDLVLTQRACSPAQPCLCVHKQVPGAHQVVSAAVRTNEEQVAVHKPAQTVSIPPKPVVMHQDVSGRAGNVFERGFSCWHAGMLRHVVQLVIGWHVAVADQAGRQAAANLRTETNCTVVLAAPACVTALHARSSSNIVVVCLLWWTCHLSPPAD